MRFRGRIAAVVLPLLVLPACGRKDGPPLYPVHGKVTFKGQPAAGATVILRRQDPEPNTTPPVPVGQVDDEGNFSLAVDDYGDGAPAGKYKVLIQWRAKVEGAEAPKPAPVKKGRRAVVIDKPELIPDRLGGRYMNPDKSPFPVVEIKSGDNTLEPFDVSK